MCVSNVQRQPNLQPLHVSKPYCNAGRISAIAAGILLVAAGLLVYFLVPASQRVRAIVLGSVAGVGGIVTIAALLIGSCKQQAALAPQKKTAKPSKKGDAARPSSHLHQRKKEHVERSIIREKIIQEKSKFRATALCGYDDVRASRPESEKRCYDSLQLELANAFSDEAKVQTHPLRFVAGSLFGLALGDALGAPFECFSFSPEGGIAERGARLGFRVGRGGKSVLTCLPRADISRKRSERSFQHGAYTDDTSLALCLADSLYFREGTAQFMTRVKDWLHHGFNNGLDRRPSFGSGKQTRTVVEDFVQSGVKNGEYKAPRHPQKKLSSGNGSVMRVAPVGISARNLSYALEKARTQSYATHTGDEAAECAAAVAGLIHYILRKRPLSKRQVVHFIQNELPNHILNENVQQLLRSETGQEEDWDWMSDEMNVNQKRLQRFPDTFGAYSLDTLFLALKVFYLHDSFEEGLHYIVDRGGDADTIAAVYGQIAGAYYGIGGEKGVPTAWIPHLFNKEKLAITAHILDSIAMGKRPF
jgi:ADP-ribosyl-[dinitrogen reductase] hydrolase